MSAPLPPSGPPSLGPPTSGPPTARSRSGPGPAASPPTGSSPPRPGQQPARQRAGREGGQVVPLVGLLLLLAGLLGMGLVHLGAAAARRAAAQTAADAAALAGAADGEDAARDAAAANDAVVVSYRQDGADVLVVVDRRGHRARARARWWPAGSVGAAATDVGTPGPQPPGPSP